MKKTKYNKGITLVALVVTIVVLIILAGISLSMILGQNGIVNKASDASRVTKEASANEESMLTAVSDNIDQIVKNIGKIDVGQFANKNSTINGEPASDTNPIIPMGYKAIDTNEAKWVNSDGKTDTDKGVVIEDKVKNQWVWIPIADISDLYDKANNAGQLYEFTSTSISKLAYRPIYNREPAYLTDTSLGDENKSEEFNSIGLTPEIIRNEFDSMIKSVTKFKGFYVGRYELTGTDAEPKEYKGTPLYGRSWYQCYTLCKKLNNNNESTTTEMIRGCQWDNVLRWLNSTGAKSFSDLVDSTSWGNYSSDLTGSMRDSGSNDTWMVNNIYDLAGNADEWTQEANTDNGRMKRGGWYNSDGKIYSVSQRFTDKTNGHFNNLSSRGILYANI